MDDELNLDLEENKSEEIISRKDKRIETLSEKVKLSEKEKAELAQAKADLEKVKAETEKERDFFKGFTQVSSKYQGAHEYQDKIWEKVKSGYDLEDATIAIMAKEGKLQASPAPQPQREMVAGGSAATAMPGAAEKGAGEMSQEERRAALAELELKGEFKL